MKYLERYSSFLDNFNLRNLLLVFGGLNLALFFQQGIKDGVFSTASQFGFGWASDWILFPLAFFLVLQVVTELLYLGVEKFRGNI